MKKLAVFVEGQTEQIFVEKLLEEVAAKKRISIEKRQAIGGQTTKRKLKIIQAAAVNSDHRYYALIVDCGGDNRVKSDVVDRYQGLISQGYEAIIAIRDVFPEVSQADIPALRIGLRYRVKTTPVEVVFVLGIMEAETWFIAEHTHFQRIDGFLTLTRIKSALGLDPSVDDIQLRPHPSEDLDKIYRLVGLVYNKSRTSVERTVNLLDYGSVFLELGRRIPDLNVLNESIDQFLTA